LYYLRARYYDPSTGRFITRDPVAGSLQNPLSQNAYQYGGDNPINNADPSEESYVMLWQEYGVPLLQKVGNYFRLIRASNIEKVGVQFTKHALGKMAFWKIDQKQALNMIKTIKPFKYYHEGAWKLGYYDPKTKIFVGRVGNNVTTVIDDVKQNYINNLLKNKP
jgi:hypothetical protein